MSAVEAVGGWPALLGIITDNRDLSREQAKAAMTDVLSGAATQAQIAGLAVALRMKGETTDEMTGLVEAMQDASEPVVVPEGTIDIVGTGGSSHRRSHALNVSTMASIVAAGGGAVVCKHGNIRASSTSGSFDFLQAIGVGIDLDGEQLARCVSEVGVGFAFARAFHPAMRFAGPVRAELGIPTVFNVLGPLANPGRVKRQVVGTATEQLAAKMANVLRNRGSLLAWVVSGDNGIDELTTTGPSTVFEVTPAGVQQLRIDPVDAGVATTRSMDDLAGGSPERNAEIFKAILDGSERGPRRDIVVLNAGAGLLVAGVVTGLREGVVLAETVIDDGRAASVLARLVAQTQ